jgi:hypothetical protein
MKNTPQYILILLVAGATACRNDASAPIPANAKTADPPVRLQGEWVSADYLRELEATKSTRAAQPACELCGFTFDAEDTTRVMANWNFHEGGDMKLVRTAGGWQIRMPDTDVRYDLELLPDGSLRSGDKTYRRLPMTEALNRIYAGKYRLDGRPVEIAPDGKVSGLGKYAYFEAIPDYITDMGRGDRIRLYEGDPDTDPGRWFGVSLEEGRMTIYDLKCLEKDENGCISEDLGKVAFNLEKEK